MTGVYVCEEGWHKLNLEEGKKQNKQTKKNRA